MRNYLILILLLVSMLGYGQFDQNVHITTIDKSTIGTGNQTYNLPSLGITYDDVQILVKNSGTGTFTIDGFNTETIDEQLTLVLNNDNDYVLLIKDESNSTNWTVVSMTASSASGFLPILDYRTKSGTANLNTTPTTVDFDVTIVDEGLFTYSNGEYTATALIDGKKVRCDFSVGGTGATNRVQIEAILQVNTGGGFVTVKQSSNYTARNNTQDRGGVNGFHILTVSTGDIIRLQADRVGSTANNDPLQTSMLFETKN